jgi:hypothetical protein
MNYRTILLAGPRAGLLAGLVVQTTAAQTNPFIVFPQDPERQTVTAASYVRRPDWNLAAEGFQEVGNPFRGVGDETGTCLARGFYHWAADENIATAETYGIVLRIGPGTGTGPMTGPAGELLRVPGLTTPTAGGGPRGSFTMVDGFATPVVVPCTGEWFMGIDMPANPAWPATDGHALWGADVPGISPATTGENPRSGAPRVTFAITAANNVVGTAWTYIMGVLVVQPTLHVGGIDPLSARQGTSGGANLGMGGLFPDISGTPRRDGLLVRVHDNVVPSGIAFVLGAPGYSPVPLPVSGFLGQVHIDFGAAATLGFVLMTGGAGEVTLAAPNTINPGFVGTSFVFQGVVFDPATGAGAFTNAQMTQL